MVKRGIRILVPFVLLGTVPYSCDRPPEGLTLAERMAVDSIFREEMKTFRPKMDSLCRVWEDSLVQAASDSMMRERLSEIEIQLRRLKQEQ